MRIIRNAFRGAGVMLIATCFLTSCGLFDIDIDGTSESAAEFSLERDSLYMMEGEQFVFTPSFSPDSVNNTGVFYLSLVDSVATMHGDTVIAQREGRATVVAMSVSSFLTDTCEVFVLPYWQPTLRVYPYITAVYADVTVQGQPVDNNMMVAAFVDGEVRAIGQVYEQNGVSVMRFRVGSEGLGSEDDFDDFDDEENGEAVGDRPDNSEIISFRCYDRNTHKLHYSRIRVVFDGNAHGTPSNPIPLSF